MSSESNKEKTKDKSSKKSNDLHKYWQVVRDNPADFPGWTYLLHYVESENNIDAAREAFTDFFSRYPYCYGYWKKYADMEKTFGSSEASEKIFENGIKAIPLSVDLWLHYINFCKEHYKDQDNYYDKVKQLFQRAVEAAGREFRSDRLWDAYIAFEEENKNLKSITLAYDKLLTIPTQLYSHHFDKFCKHIKKNSPREILSTDEFLALRREIVSQQAAEDEDDDDAADKADALPPGVESAEIAPETNSKSNLDMMTDEQVQQMKKKVIQIRRSLHEKNEVEVGKRWAFEEGIKRPYFHVKALERAQLKNWTDYLDFEIANGSHEATRVLFERCLIACALYEDMWLKYAGYLKMKEPASVSTLYERACTIHLTKKATVHFCWAAHEEQIGNPDKASEILLRLQEAIPDLLETMTRQINLERRRGNTTKVEELYLKYISEAKTHSMASYFAIKFARFLLKVEGDVTRAKDVIKEALKSDPLNPKLYFQYIDIAYQSTPIDIPMANSGFEMALNSSMTEDIKLVFSQRKLEFLEDFSLDSQSNQQAYEDHINRQKNYQQCSKKRPIEVNDEAERAKKVKLGENGTTEAADAALNALPQAAGVDSAYPYHQASAWGNHYYSHSYYPQAHYYTAH